MYLSSRNFFNKFSKFTEYLKGDYNEIASDHIVQIRVLSPPIRRGSKRFFRVATN